MNDETLEQVQTKIAFLERANADLSDVVYRQQQELRALGARLQEIAARLEAFHTTEERQRVPDDERPPHY